MEQAVTRRGERSRRPYTTVLVALAASTAAALVASAALAGPATGEEHVDCGSEITADTTLTRDIGPCLAHGLVVNADGVTLDLNGHSVTGAPVGQPIHRTPGLPGVESEPLPGSYGAPNNAGVLLNDVTGVTVTNGTVEQFDAGIAIEGGSANTIRGVTAQDNVHATRTPPCNYGDGIAVWDSDGNQLQDNVVRRNGPFSGIALVGTSADNVVTDNLVEDHTARSGLCGRSVQAIGIRVEGPGAQGNTIEGNEVVNGSLAGIGVHTYECDAPANRANTVVGNTVRETGRDTHEDDSIADGIAVMEMGPPGIVCPGHDNTIERNTVVDNYRHGVYLGVQAFGNTVSHNQATGNAGDGVGLSGPSGEYPGAHMNALVGNRGHGNGRFDGADHNDDCGSNRWTASQFDTVNQPCVRGPGGSGDARDGQGRSGSERGSESINRVDL